MIAIALACDPKILIADEPTTALDVTIQAGILDLMRDIASGSARRSCSSPTIGVVADIADRVIVMYAGRKVEEAPVHELYAHPQHPYTIGLGAIPRPGAADEQEGCARFPARAVARRTAPGAHSRRAVRAPMSGPAPSARVARGEARSSGRLLPPRRERPRVERERRSDARSRRPRHALPRRPRARREQRHGARGRRRVARSLRASCSGSSGSPAAARARSRIAPSVCSSRRAGRFG